MVWRDGFEMVKPERRQLGQYLPFVGNAGTQHVIKCGNAIDCDDQQPVAQVVDVSQLSSRREGQSGELRFKDYWCDHAGVARKVKRRASASRTSSISDVICFFL